MKPIFYRLTALILLIMLGYLFLQPIYVNSSKSWNIICKSCDLKIGDQVAIRVGNSSIMSIGFFIAEGDNKIILTPDSILLNGENIYQINNQKVKEYKKELKDQETFIIKKTEKDRLSDYGSVPSSQIIGKLLL